MLTITKKLDNAKVYKIVDNTNAKIYIGSTCNSLETRLSRHKNNYKRFLKGLCNNVTSFDIIKNNDYKIELLEDCEIKTKPELLARERYFIENNECLNKYIPGRTKKEWDIANKDKKKAYRDTNKEKINEKFDCKCGGKFTHQNKSHHIKTKKHQNFLNSNK